MLGKPSFLLCFLLYWLSLVSLLDCFISAFSILLKKCLLNDEMFLCCCSVCYIDGKNLGFIVVRLVPSCRNLQLSKTGCSGYKKGEVLLDMPVLLLLLLV